MIVPVVDDSPKAIQQRLGYDGGHRGLDERIQGESCQAARLAKAVETHLYLSAFVEILGVVEVRIENMVGQRGRHGLCRSRRRSGCESYPGGNRVINRRLNFLQV